MGVYPKIISDALPRMTKSGRSAGLNCVGKSVDFSCGCFVSFACRIEKKTISDLEYKTNGCGFMIAAAETLTTQLTNHKITSFGGTAYTSIRESIISALGTIEENRSACFETTIQAFLKSLENHRQQDIDEFTGEEALICTCFGITEDRILEIINREPRADVTKISAICQAGSGCGSCQMVIQELIDANVIS